MFKFARRCRLCHVRGGKAAAALDALRLGDLSTTDSRVRYRRAPSNTIPVKGGVGKSQPRGVTRQAYVTDSVTIMLVLTLCLTGPSFLLLPNSTGRSSGSTSWPDPSRLRLPRSSSTSNWSGNPPSPSRRSPALPRNRGSRLLGGLSLTASLGSDGCFAPRCGAPGSSHRPIAPARSLTRTHSSHSKRSSRPPAKISPRPWPLGRRCGSRIWPSDLLTGVKSRCPTEYPFLRHSDASTAFCGTPPIWIQLTLEVFRSSDRPPS